MASTIYDLTNSQNKGKCYYPHLIEKETGSE